MEVYDVQVVSVGFDNKDRKLLNCGQVPEEVVLKILELYGNAANRVSICRCPKREEYDVQQ